MNVSLFADYKNVFSIHHQCPASENNNVYLSAYSRLITTTMDDKLVDSIHCVQKKVVYQTHVDNFVNSYWIFKILPLLKTVNF